MKPAASDSDDDIGSPMPTAASLLEEMELIRLNVALELLEEKGEVEEAVEALFQEAFESMHSLPPRLSELFAAGGPGRRSTTDGDRRWLAFIEKELDEFGLPLTRYRRLEHGGHPHMVKWLRDLKEQAGGIGELLDQCERTERAAHNCCANRPRFWKEEIRYMAEQLYHTLNDPCRYAVHSWTSESHGGEELHENRPPAPRPLFGIYIRMEKLLTWLLYAGTSLRILSIFGSGGIGKTALAMELQRLFEHYQQTHVYHISAAVSLSKIRSFLCYIYQQITGRRTIREMETADTKLLILRIRENLLCKR